MCVKRSVYRQIGSRLISLVPSDRARGNGHKLKHRVTESQNVRGWKGTLWVI